MSQLYYARRSMRYGPGQGEALDRGQTLELAGMINDEKLIRLGYVAQLNKGVALVQCGKCGAKFVTDESQNAHGRMRHSEARRALTPEEEDKAAERRLRQEDELSPLNLDKTTASRGYASTPGGR
jgi:hypothetical protein